MWPQVSETPFGFKTSGQNRNISNVSLPPPPRPATTRSPVLNVRCAFIPTPSRTPFGPGPGPMRSNGVFVFSENAKAINYISPHPATRSVEPRNTTSMFCFFMKINMLVFFSYAHCIIFYYFGNSTAISFLIFLSILRILSKLFVFLSSALCRWPYFQLLRMPPYIFPITSIHLFFGLPLPRFPSTLISPFVLTLFSLFLISIRPNHLKSIFYNFPEECLLYLNFLLCIHFYSYPT